MKERDIVRKLLKALNALPNCKAIKIHGSPYMEIGTPDILGCLNGRFFAIEVKVPGEHPTEIQIVRLGQWRATGAYVTVMTDVKVDIFIENLIRGENP